MKPYQRANHYPGTFNLAHKNCLGKNLMGLGKYFPNEYDFFPRTWILPQEIQEFRNQFTAKKNKTFIVKPDALSQGNGIFLTRNCDDIDLNETQVA